MIVKELIEQLSKLNPDTKVFMQSDPEGNGYSPLEGIDPAFFRDEKGEELEVFNTKWTAQDCCMEKEDFAALRASKENQCVVLYPSY